MHHDIVQRFEVLAGGSDHIVEILGIHDVSVEDQALLADRFADIVLKRLLLRVSDDRIEDMKRVLSEETSGPESFVSVLKASIPDFDDRLREVMDQTVADFRLPSRTMRK